MRFGGTSPARRGWARLIPALDLLLILAALTLVPVLGASGGGVRLALEPGPETAPVVRVAPAELRLDGTVRDPVALLRALLRRGAGGASEPLRLVAGPEVPLERLHEVALLLRTAGFRRLVLEGDR